MNILEIIKNVILNLRDNTIESFKLAWKKKEKINNIYIWWGGLGYFFTYFVFGNIIRASRIPAVDFIAALIIVLYFILHIVLIFKNYPRPPKLTKEEKAKFKAERGQRIIKKIMLKEPLSKWKPHLVFGALDLFVITHYLAYIT